MQKEGLKANKTPGLLCLYNLMLCMKKCNRNCVKEQNKGRLSLRRIKAFQEHNILNCDNDGSND